MHASGATGLVLLSSRHGACCQFDRSPGMRGYEGGRVQPRAECRRATRLLARSTARPARSTPVLVRHGSRVDSRMALRHIRCAVGDAHLPQPCADQFRLRARALAAGTPRAARRRTMGASYPVATLASTRVSSPPLRTRRGASSWAGRSPFARAGGAADRYLGSGCCASIGGESSFEMPSRGELITEGGSRVGRELRGRLDAVRRIDDHADARDAMEPMRLQDDRIAPRGGAGSWR